MKTFARSALSIGAAAALLAACGGGSQPPIGVPGAMLQTPVNASARSAAHRLSVYYRRLYSFRPWENGTNPAAGFLDVGGTLYSTTLDGGFSNNFAAEGTVYSVSTSGMHKVLYRFTGGSDGSRPNAGLIDVNGMLYGTTVDGGKSLSGTVYSISTSGAEKVLYAFKGGSDGAAPNGLINVNGTLYGTTYAGGGHPCQTNGTTCGTVFSITTRGQETVLHRFSGRSDGAKPVGDLIDVKGLLYGTTSLGNRSAGTVFSITPAGVKKVLYAFQGTPDGSDPESGLINVNGMLYGTTFYGGAHTEGGFGDGTVYRISTKGAEKVLYSFAGGSDGLYPDAGLIDLKGILYGTTSAGGSFKKGTVYSISTTGVEKVLYSFAGGTDGSAPMASLTKLKGTLYGTTYHGGHRRKRKPYGPGTVFALTP